MRLLAKSILVIFIAIALYSVNLVWNHNRLVPAPADDQLVTTLENAIQWLTENRQHILATNNPMLWRMVQQAADSTQDRRLKNLFADYAQLHLDKHYGSIWRPLFYPNAWTPVRFADIADLPYYNWHFIYAYTCDKALAQVPEIAAQNDTAFCDQFPPSPACVTHQMMGMLLQKRSHCGDQIQLDNKIKILQQRIRNQLIWDPRIVDVTMQRVLMLVESGASNQVKPVWLQQLIDAQLPDGGWSPFMPLIPTGQGRSFGVGQRPDIRVPASSFHMTAQGVLLFALLTTQR